MLKYFKWNLPILLLLTTIMLITGCTENKYHKQSLQYLKMAEKFLLHKAAEEGDADKVQFYISQGNDINEKDENDLTPLMYAVKSGSLETVKVLVNNGCDIEKRDDNRFLTALDYAGCYNYSDIIIFLIDNGAKFHLHTRYFLNYYSIANVANGFGQYFEKEMEFEKSKKYYDIALAHYEIGIAYYQDEIESITKPDRYSRSKVSIYMNELSISSKDALIEKFEIIVNNCKNEKSTLDKITTKSSFVKTEANNKDIVKSSNVKRSDTNIPQKKGKISPKKVSKTDLVIRSSGIIKEISLRKITIDHETDISTFTIDDSTKICIDGYRKNSLKQLIVGGPATVSSKLGSKLAIRIDNQPLEFTLTLNGLVPHIQKCDEEREELTISLIEKAQKCLIKAGYELGSIDGVFGEKTRDALVKYQIENGLPKTGQLDEATQEALFATISSTDVKLASPNLNVSDKDTHPTIQSTCSSIAEVTKRDAASTFILSYEDVHKYFGEKLDPMSVAQNPTDRPWWILRTQKRIYWHGRKPATKNGALIGGYWGNAIEKTGNIFMAIRGGEMHFALAHEQDLARTLGKGSEVKFDNKVWTPLCGNNYRNGGFRITANGLEYLPGTECMIGGKNPVFRYNGKLWKKI